MAKVICKFCKQEIDKETAYNPCSRMYYCSKNHWQKKMDKDKYKPSKTKSNGEPNERRQLLDYIQELYVNQGYEKHTINWKLITSVLKNMMTENKDMKYSGIQYTLWYCKEIKDIDLFSNKSNTVLWSVPFEYQNACDYWSLNKNIQDEIKDFEFDSKVKIIKGNNNCKRKINLIDLESLV